MKNLNQKGAQVDLQKLVIGFLFDDTLDNDAGVAQYVKTLGAWLSEQGHDVCYIVGQTKLKKWAGGNIYSIAKNVPVNFNGNRLSIPLPASSSSIEKVLEQKKFDVLHVQTPHSPFMSARVINRASSKTAVIGTFHILPSGRLSKIGSKLLRLMYLGKLSRLDRVISVSAPAASFAQECYGLSTQVVPNVINLKKLQSQSKQRIKTNSIVFLGRLVPRKGCLELLKAFLMLSSWIPDARLIIAGDGPERTQLQRFTEKSGLSEKVEFKGYISEDEKPNLLGSAQLACFPALYGESFGIVLLEAMAAGSRVVLGGNNPGYSSVLAQQPELLVDPRDTDALARRLELLLNDSELQRKLSAWQKKHVLKYDVNTIGPKVLAIYKEAVTERRK